MSTIFLAALYFLDVQNILWEKSNIYNFPDKKRTVKNQNNFLSNIGPNLGHALASFAT